MTKKRLNILVTAASRRVPLIRAFKRSLQELDIDGNVIVTDINPLSPGLYVGDNNHYLPMTTDPDYVENLKTVCRHEQIDVVVPTIDDELVLMGQIKEEFARMGVTIIISPPEMSLVCNDKWKTFETFTSWGVSTPYTWRPKDLPPLSQLKYPLFLKPRMGRGSVNTYRIGSPKVLAFFLSYVKDAIVQEFLEGAEYTLDTFVDFDGNVISVVPRRRLWVRSGVMDKGVTVKSKELIQIGVDVATKLNIFGPANIQVKYSGNDPKVFEVNPRFSGGIPLTMRAGGDFPKWICQLMTGEKLKPRLGDFEDGLVMMSYEESIFRHMDVDGFDEVKKFMI